MADGSPQVAVVVHSLEPLERQTALPQTEVGS